MVQGVATSPQRVATFPGYISQTFVHNSDIWTDQSRARLDEAVVHPGDGEECMKRIRRYLQELPTFPQELEKPWYGFMLEEGEIFLQGRTKEKQNCFVWLVKLGYPSPLPT